jgi:PAS domain S-box-containing protein
METNDVRTQTEAMRLKRFQHLAIAAPAAIIVIATMANALELHQHESASRALATTDNVIAGTQALVDRLVEWESAVKGFIISGRESDLAVLDGERRDIDSLETQLRGITASDVVQTQRMDVIAHLETSAVAAMRAVVARRRASGITAETFVWSLDEHSGIDSMRVVTAAMRDAQVARRATLESAEENAARFALILLIVGAVVSIVAALLVSQLLRRAALEAERSTSQLNDRNARVAERNRLLSAVMDGTVDSVFVKDAAGCYRLINAAGAALIGRPVDEILGRPDREVVEAETAAAITARDADVMRNGVSVTGEVETTFQGVPHTFVTTRTPWRDDAGSIVGVIGVSRDITEQERHAAALHASEERLSLTLSSARVCLWDFDIARGKVHWSPEWESLLGYNSTDISSDPTWWVRLVHRGDVGAAKAAYVAHLKGETASFELVFRMRTALGTWMWVLARAKVVQRSAAGWATRLVGTALDVTAQRQLEEQLRHVQKMEAVGQLAGGVAHDFNNVLTVMTAASDFLLADPALADAHRTEVQEIRRSADRAAALTRQLLAFGRKQVLNQQVLDLNDIVERSTSMLRRTIGEDVRLVATLRNDIGAVYADQDQLEQVILNMAVNARDAMPLGGTLSLETSEAVIADSEGLAGAGQMTAAPGHYVVLTVTDTGCGMNARTRSRIFEPFFTTKPAGKGTGLGLATAYGIIRQFDGYVHVRSEVGRGSAFTIYLPRVSASSSVVPPARVPAPARGTETVLLIEDEEGVRAMVRRALRTQGYEVLEACDGEEALRLARAHNGRLDLVLSDVIMPRLNGPACAQRLAVDRPGIRVLFMSGYTDGHVVDRGILAPGVDFLHKPFGPSELLQRVRAAIDRRPRSAA